MTAVDHARDLIRVNAILPSWTETPMLDDMPPEVRKLAAGMAPMKRLGTAGEMADVVGFLASERASFITGIGIPVDGGCLATPGNNV